MQNKLLFLLLEFTELFKLWYRPVTLEEQKEGRAWIKVVPDPQLSPTICLHWYLGDGNIRRQSLDTGKYRFTGIIISTNSFQPKENNQLISLLKKVLEVKKGIYLENNRIGMNVEAGRKFLEYIGRCSPVTCFDYKFFDEDTYVPNRI